MSAPTIFQRLLSGELPCAKVYEDQHVFAFMDAGQLNPGHVLVATKLPYVTIMEADEAAALALMRAARHLARAVQQVFRPDGVTLLQANLEAGWQTVPHLHMHVLPRYHGDGVELVWPRKDPGMPALLDYAQQLIASAEMQEFRVADGR